MMSQSRLHLVRPAPVRENDHLYFERRSTDRRRVSGQATAVIAQPRSECFFGEPTSRICPLRLLNISDTGLGAISREALPVGASIVVFVAGPAGERGRDMHGSIVRCVAGEGGYQVGIRFEQRQAA